MKFFRVAIYWMTLGFLSFFAMQWVHEAGHILAAFLTGGKVVYVELRPWMISRTDINPNPAPLVTAWGGAVGGSSIPVLLWIAVFYLFRHWNKEAQFFAGFCLIANGCYLGLGATERIGDCQELLNYGATRWQLWGFGIITVTAGFWIWHELGSIQTDKLIKPESQQQP